MPKTTIKTSQASFSDLGLTPLLTKTLTELSYQQPTEIQRLAIPLLMAGKDVLAQSQTGSGKTAAFALPLLSTLTLSDNSVQALVLTPTRELAQQVCQALDTYGQGLSGLRVLALYGGADIAPQLAGLKRGAHLLVGTPGRVMDHLRRGTLQLPSLRTLVLDEADEMLRMGFEEDVQWIIDRLPSKRQTVLFSATVPPTIEEWALRYLRKPERLQVAASHTPASGVQQTHWLVSKANKLNALKHLLIRLPYEAAICFVRTREGADRLAKKLRAQGFAAGSLHGDMPQRERDRTVEALKNAELTILVATDVAARGLDVARVGLVINVDPPMEPESYLHRIGRTGRAGRSGLAVLLLTPNDEEWLKTLEQAHNIPIKPIDLPSEAEVSARHTEQLLAGLEAIPEAELDKHQQTVQQLLARSGLQPEALATRLLALLAPTNENSLANLPPEPPALPRQSNTKNNEKPALRPTRTLVDMEHYRIEIGRRHGLSTEKLEPALLNATGIEKAFLFNTVIHDYHSCFTMPAKLTEQQLEALNEVRLCKRPLLFDIDEYAKRPKKKGKRPF